jgi:hypothetical protein
LVVVDDKDESCLSTSTVAKQAVAKQTSRVLLYDHDDLSDDVDASVRAVLDGRATMW